MHFLRISSRALALAGSLAAATPACVSKAGSGNGATDNGSSGSGAQTAMGGGQAGGVASLAGMGSSGAPTDPGLSGTGAGNGGSGNGGAAGSGADGNGSAGINAGAGASSGAGGTAGSASETGGTGGSLAAGGGSAGAGGASSAIDPLLGDVAFSTPSQSFKDSLAVGLTTTIAGAEIRYTTDGTLPTASSTLYAGTPIDLVATTQLRAAPFVGGQAGGQVSTAIYIARTFDVTSPLPILLLDDYGSGPSTDKNVYIDAAVMIFEPIDGTASLANLPSLAARAGFHLRGQSSSSFAQKPYKVEFRDNDDGDPKYPVLGMAPDADWALIAPYYDRSLLRNPFTYGLGREMGLGAPETRFAEVYLNFEPRALADTDYVGIYWVSETIEINGHRTALQKLSETDTAEPEVSGGYIFKFDLLATDAMAPHLTCTESAGVTCWTDCELAEPVPLPAPTEQLAFITSWVQRFHDTLFTAPLGDYGQYIDVASFVDYLIINELTRNLDSYTRSAFYSKDRGGLLRGGPLWDYNFSLGVGGRTNTSPTPGASDSGWQYRGLTEGSLPSRNASGWFAKLMTDPTFAGEVTARWQALRLDLLSDAALDQRITELGAQLPSDATARDFAKWPVAQVFATQASGNTVNGPSAETWEGQVQGLRDFVTARSAWMDSQLQ